MFGCKGSKDLQLNTKIICVNIQIQELMVENNDMRETLKSMQAELIKLLNQQNEDYESNTEVGI